MYSLLIVYNAVLCIIYQIQIKFIETELSFGLLIHFCLFHSKMGLPFHGTPHAPRYWKLVLANDDPCGCIIQSGFILFVLEVN